MNLRALVAGSALVALAGCGHGDHTADRTSPSGSAGSAGASVRAATGIPAASRQLVTAIIPSWDATTAELRLWTRAPGGAWTAAGEAWAGVIGHTGAAWGTGLHGAGAPAGHAGPTKHEGDGKSPAGVFALAGSYGYAPSPPSHATLPYVAVDTHWKCVDDPHSSHYNVIVDDRAQTKDWTSAEDMRRDDALYTWVVEVAHNPDHAPGDGSCIFLHVWGGPASTTVGCTAMPEDKLAGLIAALTPSAQPVLVLLPQAEYDALRPTWLLP